eukprot:COSAG04_NODE_2184_length_4595_cov_11.453292_4_plen_31_part_00
MMPSSTSFRTSSIVSSSLASSSSVTYIMVV